MELTNQQICKRLEEAEPLPTRLLETSDYLQFFRHVFGCPTSTQTLSAQSLSQCDRASEIFTFEVPNYAISHQNGAVLNIKVAYYLTLEAISKNDYPDFVSIRKEIDNYLTYYPNNNDYWEIVNKNLVKQLLENYLQMSSLIVELRVMPTPHEPFVRSSIVRNTRS